MFILGQDHPEVCNDESFKCKLGDDCYPSRYVCDGDAQCTGTYETKQTFSTNPNIREYQVL